MIRRVFTAPRLKRAVWSYLFVGIAEFAAYFTSTLYAFEQGGASLAGIATAAQLAPAALLVPLLIRFIERRGVAPMRFAIIWLGLSGVGLGLVVLDAPVWLFITLAALRAIGYSLARPIHLALIPVFAERPSDTTAGMIVTGWIDSAVAMIGPALAAAILVFGQPAYVFWAVTVAAVLAFVSAPVSGVLVEGDLSTSEHRPVMSIDGAKTMMGYKTAASVLSGATHVIVVIVAIDLLGLGESGAGYVASLVGAGELVGSLFLISLLGRSRLRGFLGFAAFGRGVFISLLGVIPAATPLVGLSGAFTPLHRVAQRLMLERITPPDRYLRVFGFLESFDVGGQALGALLVPVAIALFGAEGSIVVLGAILPFVFLSMSRAFGTMDRRGEIPSALSVLISSSEALGGLADDVVEYLARHGVVETWESGEVVIHQGDTEAESAWMIIDGAVDVMIDGLPVTVLGPAELVGEMALISGQPRSADVTALDDTTVLRIDRDSFLDVVVGSRPGGERVRVLAVDRAEENERR